MTDELDQELEGVVAKYGKFYTKKVCVKCDKKFIGGTTALYCVECGRDIVVKKQREVGKAQRIMKKLEKDKKCLFCETSEKLNIHHIDRDSSNHSESNMVYLCSKCHMKLHGKVYNPLLKRVFRLLVDDRHTYQDIAMFFGTTKQNVYGILNKKVSTANTIDNGK